MFELTHRIVRRLGRVDEQAGIARGVRQERHDRHERQRRMEAAAKEREPRERTGAGKVRPALTPGSGVFISAQ